MDDNQHIRQRQIGSNRQLESSRRRYIRQRNQATVVQHRQYLTTTSQHINLTCHHSLGNRQWLYRRSTHNTCSRITSLWETTMTFLMWLLVAVRSMLRIIILQGKNWDAAIIKLTWQISTKGKGRSIAWMILACLAWKLSLESQLVALAF